ncbi:MAG TPA: thioredoxin domain-containing protein [Methylomirabilota bacterium]|nr:thioredoxin domain-containing protein [Methylomirabilota bacterium]
MALLCALTFLGCQERHLKRSGEKMGKATNQPAAKHANRLSREKSPYLLQHQHNPVDWFAWGEEAFAKARAEDKPIFLSIGYSTCHWCHVMERESFESEEVAAYLNEHFVSIKVDREERPDVDKIYMSFVQATSGQGGWPLNVFLTPELKPFYGGTYFPPTAKYGRPSFLQLLQQLAEVWKTRRAEIEESAKDIHQQLGALGKLEADPNTLLTPGILEKAARTFAREYDPHHGGFGTAPKFPRPTQPAFLLRWAVRQGNKEVVDMVLHTCDAMAAGGIYDQIGGGFARYSVDQQWLVPHFEKMLYDNAQLVQLYLDAYLVSGDQQQAEVARDIIRYVLRDMTYPEGGFYSAEDADSEGKEGKFYCWTEQELKELLTPDEFRVASEHFGVTKRGNFLDHSDPDPLPDLNVLSIAAPLRQESDRPLLASARKKMFERRAKRVRPHLDDKILASWNGMMLGAMARASVALGEPALLAAAEKNLRFVRSKLWDAKGKKLHSRWRDGERDDVLLLDAHANMLAGVLDLYEATLDPAHLQFALDLGEAILRTFYDPQEGGFWQTPAGAKDLILRAKDDYDGAEPSGNSVTTHAFLRLSAITERGEFKDAADNTLRAFSQRMDRLPQAVPNMLAALDFSMEEPRRVVIAGDPKSSAAKSLIQAAHQVYQPNKVVLGTVGPVEPFARTLKPQAGPASVYLCTGNACQPPTSDPAQLKASLKR